MFGIAPGALSQILSGKRSPKEAGNLRISRRIKASSKIPVQSDEAIEGIGVDAFRAISDWYHYAIREMVGRADFQAKPAWIAKRLDISLAEAKLAFGHLESLKLNEPIDPSRRQWRKTSERVQTKDRSKTSECHKRRQHQILEKSRIALDSVPISERVHSGITINVDRDRLNEYRERIQAELWRIAHELELGNPRRVYEVSLQIFPLESSSHSLTRILQLKEFPLCRIE